MPPAMTSFMVLCWTEGSRPKFGPGSGAGIRVTVYNVTLVLPVSTDSKPDMRHLACVALALCLRSARLAHGQEKTIAAPPNVTTEGIPPIPQSIADGLAKYAQFRQAQMMAWNPVKRQILVTTALGTVPQLYSVDGPGPRSSSAHLVRSAACRCSPTCRSIRPTATPLVFQYDPTGASELRSLYRYDMTSGEISLVTESKTRFAHVWSHQGKWLAYDSAERNGKDRDLYVIQPSDPEDEAEAGRFRRALLAARLVAGRDRAAGDGSRGQLRDLHLARRREDG